MKYCTNCVLPESRPNLVIEEDGVCNACKASEEKEAEIDWLARDKAFKHVIANAKSRSQGYDCLIPVSGGKDSTWQVLKCLDYGLNPLCVTWRPPGRTEIGQKNLENLISIGVDHIDYSISPKTERQFTYNAFKKYGTAALPMHYAIFNMPLRTAYQLKIPLLVYGENSAFEYGGDGEEREGFTLDSKWIAKYGISHGTVTDDWISGDLTKEMMVPYIRPSDEELDKENIKAIFLGYYFKWDPVETKTVAEANGFTAGTAAKVGLYDYADIDDDFISIHHYLKWHKFGFTRLFDNLSLEIRNGRITRDEAIQIIREKGDQTPHEDIEKFCKFLDITKKHFFEICETFRNHDIWTKEGNKYVIKDFLIDDWEW